MSLDEFITFMLKKNGIKQQAVVCIEEMSEFQKELSKYLRGCGDKCHIIEELADVQLTILEMQKAFHISSEDIERQMKYKMIRTLSRLED